MCVQVYALQRPYKTDQGDGNEENQTEKKRPDRFIGRKRSAHSVSEGGWVDGTLRFGQRNSD